MEAEGTGPSGAGGMAPEARAALVRDRRHLHAHPELSFHEFDTAAYIAERLRQWPSFRVRTQVGGTGVVADAGEGSGPVVLLRADMDALPIEEPAGALASTSPGRMHACGHDAHCAMLLGAAAQLDAWHRAGQLAGRVRLVFQPAEEADDAEGHTGAYHLIQAGVLDDVALGFALHVNPEAPVGVVDLWTGYAMASCDVFEGIVMGRGGHAGYPDRALDPVWILGPVLTALHSIVSRRVSPLDSAVITVGRVAGGTAPNVTPSDVTLNGTLRAYSPRVRQELATELERAFQVARALGGDYRLRIRRGEPPLHNDGRANEVLAAALAHLAPEVRVRHQPFGMAAEDFAYIAEQVPAALAFVGCGAAGQVSALHSPAFALDERVLPLGAAWLAESARTGLAALREGILTDDTGSTKAKEGRAGW